MESTHSDWKNAVIDKLILNFESDAECLARILHYVEEEECRWDPTSDAIVPVWRMLKNTFRADEVFRKYAEHLATETRKPERDRTFRNKMADLHLEIIKLSEDKQPSNTEEDIDSDDDANADPPGAASEQEDAVYLYSFDVAKTSSFAMLAKVWPRIPLVTQSEFLIILPGCLPRNQVVKAGMQLDGWIDWGLNVGNKVARAPIELTGDASRSLQRWWNGEVSGKRCAMTTTHSVLSIGAGLAGGYRGAALGSTIGPIGMLAGGIVGGMVSTNVASYFCEPVTQSLFDLPKTETLEKAYKFLGVDQQASDEQLVAAFRKLVLLYHPDKPEGDELLFHQLQIHMATIKAARGETY